MIRILVIEDEEPLRMVLVDALRSESFDVSEAGDGELGLHGNGCTFVSSNRMLVAADVQVASYALFAGRDALAKKVVAASRERRIKPHIKPDGSQPHELARTKSLSYSAMNLRGLMHLGALGERTGVDVWNYVPAGGGGIRAAIDYLAPYADPKQKWPHKQIAPFGHEGLFPLLRRAATGAGRPTSDPPSSIQRSCNSTSCAVCQRSSAFFSRLVRIKRSSAGGDSG